MKDSASKRIQPVDRFVAKALCDATREVLWAHTRDWALRKIPNLNLTYRVGKGQRTYLRAGSNGQYLLNFGAGMVHSKRQKKSDAARWTTGKEITNRRYFGGDLSLMKCLAHTAVHEFGHVIQRINGWRYDGSVHNTDFYRILDRIHTSGKAHEVLGFLEDRVGILEFESDFDPMSTVTMVNRGDRIAFDIRGTRYQGVVSRINTQSYSVKLANGTARVPFHLAEPLAKAG